MQPVDPPISLRIRKLVLTVRDLDRMADFYRSALGLWVLGRDRDTARLGTRTTVLLVLQHDTHARPASPREAGLYHVAFLLPGRSDLARWLAHAVRTDVPLDGAADHHVSEAIYLSDPEGNGIEIACDRPRAAWRWVGETLAFATDPLDAAALLRDAGKEDWDGVPDGTTIGHVHLKVGATAPAEAFYGGVLGIPLTARYPGAGFFGADRYHHHLAANTWGSRNAGPRAAGGAGLSGVEIQLTDAALVEAVAHRATAAGLDAARSGPALLLRDPWGTPFTLTSSEA